MAINTFQVTIGAGVTRATTSKTPMRQVTIQNNSAHICRVGDSNTTTSRGYSLEPGTTSFGGAVTWGGLSSYDLDLSEIYIAGTAADVIDIIYID